MEAIKTFITQEKPWILRILHKHSFIRVLTIPFNLFTVANSHYNSVDKTKLSSLERLFRSWPSETDFVGTFYETPQNYLVDFLTLLHKLQRETSPKNLLKPLPFCDLHTRKADAYQRLLTFFCVACAKKCLYAVLLNANNIRLLTKCDAALLSFRYTSIFFLNPVYVAARSLRSLRSKKGERILEIITFYQNALRLFTRMHCALYQSALRHEQHEVVTLLWWRLFFAWIADETG